MNRQNPIDKNNRAENAKQQMHLYREGNLMLLRKGTENKYETPFQVPYCILRVNDNGTVCLRVTAVEVTINIRRITPYTNAGASYHGGQCSLPHQMISRRVSQSNPDVGQMDQMCQMGHMQLSQTCKIGTLYKYIQLPKYSNMLYLCK